MKNGIKDKVRDHIVETWLNGDARGFDDESDLNVTGVLDSFSTLALASFLDDTFGVAIDPIDINTETFRSVDSIAELVLSKLDAAA
jgi:acyl carrier protein